MGFGSQAGNGGGGAPSAPTNITYAALLTLYNAGTMVPGFYNVTDRADRGLIIEAVTASKLALTGTGLFVNPDFQGAGIYTGVVGLTGVAYVSTDGVWTLGYGATTIAYNTLAGGSFAIGETITEATNGATGIVISDDGSTMTLWRTTPLNFFVAGNTIDNGTGVTANETAVTIVDKTGSVVLWGGLHYQVVDISLWNGANPSINSAFSLLPKSTANVGYVLEADAVEYNFVDDLILVRSDKRLNIITYPDFNSFQFGNDSCSGCQNDETSVINNINQKGIYGPLKIIAGATLNSDNTHYGRLYDCLFNGMEDGTTSAVYNINMASGKFFRGNVIEVNQTINFDGSNNILSRSFRKGVLSTFNATKSITGITTLDITSGLNYVGIVYLTSGNLTESINLFANFPANQPISFYPNSTLTVTFVHGIGANQPECAGGIDAVLNGNNGDYIEFTIINGKIKQTGGETF